MRRGPSRSWRIAQRLALAILGGYVAAAGLAALAVPALARAMAPSDAGTLMAMLAFPLYLVLLLWAFAERRLARLWILLGLGGPLALGLSAVLGAP